MDHGVPSFFVEDDVGALGDRLEILEDVGNFEAAEERLRHEDVRSREIIAAGDFLEDVPRGDDEESAFGDGEVVHVHFTFHRSLFAENAHSHVEVVGMHGLCDESGIVDQDEFSSIGGYPFGPRNVDPVKERIGLSFFTVILVHM